MDAKLPELTISFEKAFHIADKAREFEEKTEASDLEEGSNASDDKFVAVLEEQPDDATRDELMTMLAGLNEDEQLDLIALTWVGRGDFGIEEWERAREEASAMSDKHIPLYLLETPLFSDYLAEGLALAGHDVNELRRQIPEKGTAV